MLVLVPRDVETLARQVVDAILPFAVIEGYSSREEVVAKIVEASRSRAVDSIAILGLVGLDTVAKAIEATEERIAIASLDSAVYRVLGEYIDSPIAVYVDSSSDAKAVDSIAKAILRDSPVDIVVVDSAKGMLSEIPKMVEKGFRIHLAASPRLCLELVYAGGSVLLRDVSIVNSVDVLATLLHRSKDISIPRSFYIAKVLPCIAESDKIRVVIKFDASLSWALKGFYLAIPGSTYSPAIEALTFRGRKNELATLYGDGRLYLATVESIDRAKEIANTLLSLAEQIYRDLARVEQLYREIYKARQKLSVLDIYRLLPGKNCGECGEKTCMAFAAKLLRGEVDADRCPYLDEDRRKKLNRLVKPLGIVVIP